MGNCDSLLFLGGADATTLEYISKTLGKETIRSINNSRSYGKQGSHSMSYNKTGRELMTPDELRVMDNNNCVLLIRGLHPFFATKYPLEQHPNYSRTADGNKDLLFDVKEMLTTGKSIGEGIKVNESLPLKVFKEAQKADTREGERQHRYYSRSVEMKSARGRRLHEVTPLSEEIPNIHIPANQRTAEQQAELEETLRTISIEEIVPPAEEDMAQYQAEIHNHWFAVPEEELQAQEDTSESDDPAQAEEERGGS